MLESDKCHGKNKDKVKGNEGLGTGIRVQFALLNRVVRVTPIKKVRYGQRLGGLKGKSLKK